MPEEALWSTFFDAGQALRKLWPQAGGDALELGCGYGTFTFAAARRTDGLITTLDIEPAMVALVRARATELGLPNIQAQVRDFVADGFGIAPGSQSHVMIYNLLHMDEPVRLLRHARHVLRSEGTVSVMHWRSDTPTPRGPPMDIRPSAEMCATWLAQAGFTQIEPVDLGDCCPFHYGLAARTAAEA
ncbi:class I SAM-dependent methyltransferase [Dyella acidiphila]|nr:class I SAM-dependent methyltransferase [Dyella acidiphila]